eukprot:2216118-Rhodomonas_salina.1
MAVKSRTSLEEWLHILQPGEDRLGDGLLQVHSIAQNLNLNFSPRDSVQVLLDLQRRLSGLFRPSTVTGIPYRD